MKKLVLTISSLFFAVLLSTNGLALTTDKNLTSSSENKSIADHMQLLRQFKSMYENKHFNSYLFDTKEGYVQSADSADQTKMPLNYFIQYNNIWWFSIISKVEVLDIGYNHNTNTGLIVLKIYYDKNVYRDAMQYVKFNNGKINYIRTYASPDFFASNQDNTLVKLDSYGNQIWQTRGFNLNYSIKATLLFLQESPVGQSFSENPVSSKAIKNIITKLHQFLQNTSSQ